MKSNVTIQKGRGKVRKLFLYKEAFKMGGVFKNTKYKNAYVYFGKTDGQGSFAVGFDDGVIFPITGPNTWLSDKYEYLPDGDTLVFTIQN